MGVVMKVQSLAGVQDCLASTQCCWGVGGVDFRFKEVGTTGDRARELTSHDWNRGAPAALV